MLKCRDISQQTSDYQDRQLPLSARLAFAMHLLMCGKCRLFVAHMKSASRVYMGLGDKQLDAIAADQLASSVIAKASANSAVQASRD